MLTGCESSHEKNSGFGERLTTEEGIACKNQRQEVQDSNWRDSAILLRMTVSCGTIISTTAVGFTMCQCQEGSFHLHRDIWAATLQQHILSSPSGELELLYIFHNGCYYFS